MSKRKIKELKEKVLSLAQLATDKIYENKFLIEQISVYENQIKLIKDFLTKLSSLGNDENSKRKIIFDEINNIHNQLKISNKRAKEENSKLSQKIVSFQDEIFNEDTTLRQNLKINKIDNFILEYQLKKNDVRIKQLNDKLKELGENKLFSTEKKELKVSDNVGCYYIDNDLEISSKILMKELLFFNISNTQCIKYNTKKKKLLDKIQLLDELVNAFKKNIKKTDTKIYKEDKEDELNNFILKDINNQKSSRNKQEKEKKITLLTVSQLFDVNNDEGKSEEIIDEELHSDDEIIFEPKIKHQKKISIDENLIKIRTQVPGVDLSQINFNKQKVMNEADLYSLQNRKFKAQNIDEQINEMKYRRKEMLHKFKVNYKKLNALKNFADNTKNSYKLLKPLKLKTSVINFGGTNGFNNNIINEMNEGLNEIEEIKEDENENNDNEENDDNIVQENNLIEENIIYTQRSLSGRKRRDLNNKKLKNNSFRKKKDKRKKQNRKIKRAKSK